MLQRTPTPQHAAGDFPRWRAAIAHRSPETLRDGRWSRAVGMVGATRARCPREVFGLCCRPGCMSVVVSARPAHATTPLTLGLPLRARLTTRVHANAVDGRVTPCRQPPQTNS